MWWPTLFDKLNHLIDDNSKIEDSISTIKKEDKNNRNTEILEEILEISRHNTRSISNTDKILADLIQENRPFREKYAEFRHPIFKDLEITWLELRQALIASLVDAPVTPEIKSQIGAINRIIEYISNQSRIRPRLYRSSQKMLGEE
ncbi:hypothetical protein [Xanthobacter autotrophicus]|uniref:hypothetical protein n=1 Tax=Xanthobacter autotrophicus TaxID=280 RepID=UPI0024A6109E|nr:hypothetical protein [Xanthobacter autotrophicus]MDI4656613.1 hypothetical protein [Xanthobacter autotrophicus]